MNGMKYAKSYYDLNDASLEDVTKIMESALTNAE
jgi:hypothetical protein